APPSFRGLDRAHAVDIWTPLTPDDRPEARENRGLGVVARLKRGATRVEAQAQLTALAAQLAHDFPKTNLGTLDRPHEPRPMTVTPATRIGPDVRSQGIALAAVLRGGAGPVVVRACGQAPALPLAGPPVGGRESPVRRALGGGCSRLRGQLWSEPAVLATGATGVGLLLAAWTADALPLFFPAEQAALL